MSEKQKPTGPERLIPRDEDLPESEAARDRAKELFVHGLLRAQAGIQNEEARATQEARIQRICAAIGRETVIPGEKIPIATLEEAATLPMGRRPRRPWSLPRVIAGAAAAVLVAMLAWQLWPTDETERAYALAEHALEHTHKGVHVYEAEFWVEGRRGSRKFGRAWQVALGPEGSFHIRLEDERASYQIGSDGKRLWVVPPRGHPFEVPGQLPKQLRIEGLGPELSYYELRPFLHTILLDSKLEYSGKLSRGGESLVQLSGAYRPGWRKRRGRSRSSGSIEMLVSETSGLLQEFRLSRTSRRGAIHFELSRQATPVDLKSAGILFTPPETKTPGGMKLGYWFLELMRSTGRELRKRRTQQKASNKPGKK